MLKLISIKSSVEQTLRSSEAAYNNKSMLVAEVWSRNGLKLNPEQLLQIQAMNSHLNPDSILREARRAKQRGIKPDLMGSSRMILEDKPRRKLLGIFG